MSTEVQDWLSQKLVNTQLDDGVTYTSIANFCVMWALFEGTELSDADSAVDELAYVACRLVQRGIDVTEPLDFWSNRYIDSEKTNGPFDKLGFSHVPHINLVADVLIGNQTDPVKIVHAILLIVYRLRNNLFHGNKDITRIHNQVTNLDMASKTLMNVASVSGRYVFLNNA
ncbi:conserved hypothetical protein [Vibrio chagasii]|uniref:hypothetical protein n=1 Tax=Vibrio coralliirubri TaxID=1516159 RepID=UPI000631CA3C|nr:hypothetical protein [Vibrio coralliirubri]CAH6803010.1 conserved hypothetical protein [Vibrio chagasii]CAH6840571.1 conserved hypothetical protein [Vibrio chagasii]CAH6842470.1 conserved hypothetical protein [Vibrio chagasii]CAH7063242.1 conserved hypothetical protein [Vibrio chagasii]CAH7098587.1 conserved hypothetical protein [Vibrio chagasii]